MNELDPIAVLLVEDDPGDVVLVQEAMSQDKIANELFVVHDGVEALEFLRDPDNRVPDLILLDLNLPRKDGREVLAEIRTDPQLSHLPVVVLTTSEAEADILASYELHANAYVSKPVDLDRFLEVVRAIDNFFISIVKLPGRGA
ncbi:response regulator [Conexibacter sp. DBS9H8]|uniref:response regulator n=1 Tax=Conexibacter sp. DBS9H8 TaxID=2937801 RepID=UPI00200C9C5E|nr:response regulator [Conexibacter sp. DBS9H8]